MRRLVSVLLGAGAYAGRRAVLFHLWQLWSQLRCLLHMSCSREAAQVCKEYHTCPYFSPFHTGVVGVAQCCAMNEQVTPARYLET